MTHSHNLTWVEWLDADSFVSADTGGHIHTHTFDLARLTKKISRGKYEDKEEPRRTFSQHAPFGVYQVYNTRTITSSGFYTIELQCRYK